MRRDIQTTVVRSDGQFFVNGTVPAGTALLVSPSDGTVLTSEDGGAYDVYLDRAYVGLLAPEGTPVTRADVTPSAFEGRPVLVPAPGEAPASGETPAGPARAPSAEPATPPAGRAGRRRGAAGVTFRRLRRGRGLVTAGPASRLRPSDPDARP